MQKRSISPSSRQKFLPLLVNTFFAGFPIWATDHFRMDLPFVSAGWFLVAGLDRIHAQEATYDQSGRIIHLSVAGGPQK